MIPRRIRPALAFAWLALVASCLVCLAVLHLLDPPQTGMAAHRVEGWAALLSLWIPVLVTWTARLYRMVHWFGGSVLVGDLVREEERAGITSAD